MTGCNLHFEVSLSIEFSVLKYERITGSCRLMQDNFIALELLGAHVNIQIGGTSITVAMLTGY